MKKILFLIPFLAGIIYADTNTGGSLQLLLPAVGTVDTNRSYGSKLNANFSIIDSSFSTLQSAVQSSTANIVSSFNTSTANITSFLNTFTSTVQTRIDNLQTFTSTAQTRIDSIQTFTSTAQTRIDNLQTFTSTAQAVIDSHTSSITAISNSTTTLFSQINSTAVQLSNFITSANSTMTALSNSTNTFLNAGKNNAGVIFSSMTTGLPTTTTPRSYTLYVGTPGTPNVDTIVGGSASFDAMFASVAAHGLTLSDTAQATIYINPGLYQVSNATIPAGITLVCASSAVFSPTDNATSIMTVYGKVSGCFVDMAYRTFVGPTFILGSHANIDNVRITTGSMDTTANTTLFLVQNATDVKVNARVDSFNPSANSNNSGALLNISNSTNCIFNLNVFNSGGTTGNGQSVWIQNVTNVVYGGNYDQVGGRFLIASGTNTNLQIGGYYHITRKYAGAFLGLGQGASSLSTGTYINGAVFYHDANQTAPLISMYGDTASDRINALVIENCYAYSSQLGAGQPTFVDTSQGGNSFDFNIILKNNSTYNMAFISDSNSTGTKYQSLGNTRDGVPQ